MGSEFFPFAAEILGCGSTEGSVAEMTDLGSHPAEMLGGGRGGSATEMTGSGSHLAEVLRGGRDQEGSGTEFSVSDAHPAEVLECPAEGSEADWTISILSEFAIMLAVALTIAPVDALGF